MLHTLRVRKVCRPQGASHAPGRRRVQRMPGSAAIAVRTSAARSNQSQILAVRLNRSIMRSTGWSARRSFRWSASSRLDGRSVSSDLNNGIRSPELWSQRQATKRGGWPQAHPATSTSRVPEHRIVQNNGLPVQTKADVDLRQIRTGSCHPRQRRTRILQTASGTTLQAMRDDQWARHSIPFFKEPRVHRLYAISR